MKKYFSLLPIILLYFFATVQPIQAQTTESKKVFITRTGEKYHTSNCRYIKQSGKEVELDEAVKSYTPCSVCKPPKKESSNSVVPATSAVPAKTTTVVPAKQSSSPRTTSSVQCSGATKAGNRCKRKTTASNGRCYQH